MMIGATVVAYGTTTPELFVSVDAALSGSPGISIGNVVGSSIFNILAVLGLSSLVSPDGIAVAPAMVTFDIPIAILGLLMYIVLVALTLARLLRPALLVPASMAALAITGAGTLYSAWLTWVEIEVLEAICQWCVASAIVTSVMLIIEIVIFSRLWAADDLEDIPVDA